MSLFHNLIFLGFLFLILGLIFFRTIKVTMKKSSLRTNITSALSIFLLLGATCLNHAAFKWPIIPTFLLIYCLTGIFLAFFIVYKNHDLLLKPFIVMLWRLLLIFALFCYLLCLVLWIVKLIFIR